MAAFAQIPSAADDPLSRFGDHERLIADLAAALEPARPQAVLAVFELVGADDYRQRFGEQAGEGLIRRGAERFARVIQPSGVCYRARQDEFCALVDGSIDETIPTLAAAEQALRDDEAAVLVSACFGAALLPDEAADPIELLILADQRLRLRIGSHTARTPSPSAAPFE